MANVESIYRNNWLQYYNQRKERGTEGQRGSRGAMEKEHRHPKSMDTLRWALARESQIALSGTGMSYDIFMQFWVNPSECSWQVGLRSAITKTSGGAIHHEIAPNTYFDPEVGITTIDPQYSRYEFPVLNISFQSGIIIEGAYNHIMHKEVTPKLAHGLNNFYDFLDLLDQPNQLTDGSPNFVNIFYISPVHGANGIWLKGFFLDDGTSWTDSANDPLSITNWKASFLVCSSNPALKNLKSNYSAAKLKTPIENLDAIIAKEKELREKTQRDYRSWKDQEDERARQFAGQMLEEEQARRTRAFAGTSAYKKSLEDRKRVTAALMARDAAERQRAARMQR